MKVRQTILSLILLLYLTNCRLGNSRHFSDYKSEKIISPTKKYYLITTVNQTNKSKDDYAEVLIHLYNSGGQLKLTFNTKAGDANKWAVGWDQTKDTIILFSSDVGSSAWRIENSQLKNIELTGELNSRATALKQEKYKD